MAINTRAKRQSAAQVGAPLPPSILPTGTINGLERQQAAWTYSGVSVVPPPPEAPPSFLLLMRVGS